MSEVHPGIPNAPDLLVAVRDYPTVSVVIPVYNRLRYLPETVESVLSQKYSHIQLIIYDDGSEQIELHQYYESLRDSRVKIIRGLHSGFIAASRNRGAKHAVGEYIAFLDSDDLWHPEKLVRQVPTLRKTGFRWSHARFGMIDDASEPTPMRAGGKAPARHGWILEHILTTQVWVAINTVVMELTLFKEVGGFHESPELNGREDYDLFMRIAEREPIHFLDEVLGWVREHSQRTTHTIEDAWGKSAILYERFLARTNDPHLRNIAQKRLTYHQIRSAWFDCVRRKDPDEASRKLRRSWRRGWRTPKWWFQWGRVFWLMLRGNL